MTSTSTTAGQPTLSRRAFLRNAGFLVVAIGTSQLVNPRGVSAVLDDFPIGPLSVDPTQLDSWLAIDGSGGVTYFSGKEELGQGVATAVLQVVADELDVAPSSVRAVISDTWRTVDQGYTAGSQSLFTEYGPNGVRQACAEARAALLNMASAQLGAPAGSLIVANGIVSVAGAPARTVSYAQLVGGKKLNLPITGKAIPKSFDQYKIVGTSLPRIDIPGKATGQFTFTQDIRVPGLVHARVVRPPTLDSQLVSIDGFRGGKPRGLVKVVAKHNFVAVVAESEFQAIVGAGTLEVKWSPVPLPSYSTFFDDLMHLSPTTDRVLIDTNDVDQTLAAAAKTVTAAYRFPIQMHGSMGTSASTAWVEGDTATVWTSSQGVYQLRGALATALSMPPPNIHVIFVEGSGCYGLNGADNASLDAAVISQMVGRPVRVQYTRADEHRWENYCQPYVIRLTGGLDSSGATARVSAWDYTAWTASRGGRPGPPANLPTGILLGFPENPLPPSPPPTPSEAPDTVDNSNTAPAYVIKSQRAITHTGVHSFLAGPLRSPNRVQNTFANESFIDELAFAAGADPIAFRLAQLSDERLITVLQTVRQMAGWSPRPAASKIGKGRFLTGRGVAAVHYEGTSGYNALALTVAVDTKTGKVMVDRAWSAQDCGPAVNPDGMRQQAEGCLMQSISRALQEEVKWRSDGITSTDWITYPVVRFTSMPKSFEFRVISRHDQPVVGAGEVLITNGPAAIANAIFDATGQRLRQIPFTPARVKAALKT